MIHVEDACWTLQATRMCTSLNIPFMLGETGVEGKYIRMGVKASTQVTPP